MDAWLSGLGQCPVGIRETALETGINKAMEGERQRESAIAGYGLVRE